MNTQYAIRTRNLRLQQVGGFGHELRGRACRVFRIADERVDRFVERTGEGFDGAGAVRRAAHERRGRLEVARRVLHVHVKLAGVNVGAGRDRTLTQVERHLADFGADQLEEVLRVLRVFGALGQAEGVGYDLEETV